jgi:hypothetical protein
MCLAYNSAMAKKRNSYWEKDYNHMSIGPGLGGSVFFSEARLKQDKIYTEYFWGGKVILKPSQPLGLETGYYFHRGSEDYRYHSTPIILAYTNSKQVTFKGGLIFLYNKIENNQVNYKDPDLGGIFIVELEKIAIGWLFYPALPFSSDPELPFDNLIFGFKIEYNILFSLF